jgi:hypothetical protein
MMSRRVLLWPMNRVMLIVQHPEGVRYQNQVGGNACWQAELEGVLCPLGMDVDNEERVAALPYRAGNMGITTEIADTIDAILAAKRSTAFLKVDRTRLDEVWEAWVYVVIDDSDDDAVPLRGFGATKGVLTWRNSD